MKKSYLRAFIPDENRAEVLQGEPGSPISFVASTEPEARDGLSLILENWNLENFEKNPVFLWSHDYWGSRLPIGRAEVFKDLSARQLKTLVYFDQKDEFARQVERKYREGFLHAVSVGWDSKIVDGKQQYELLDISGVTIPGDPDALMERQYRLLKDLFEADEEESGSEPPKEEHWERAAAEMADLFSPECVLAESERQTIYHRLTKEYRKLGKTPPELLSMETIRSLGMGEISGLFLEGEDELFERLHGFVGLTKERKRKLKEILEQALELVSENEEDPEDEEDPGDQDEIDEQDLAELEKVAEALNNL